MTKAIVILTLFSFVGCSGVPKTGDPEADKVISHMSKGRTVVGADWQPKFLKDGLVNGEFIAIGSVTNEINRHEGSMKVMAESDATSRLLTSAPTEFKKIVIRAINSIDDSNGSVEQSHVSVTEVRALTGLKTAFDDSQCVTYATPTTELKYEFKKECRVIIRVPSSELMKAYRFTLSDKYKIKEQSEIAEALKAELFGKKPKVSSERETASESTQANMPVAKAYQGE